MLAAASVSYNVIEAVVAITAGIVAGSVALVGFGFSAYLTYLELFVIDAICQWCVASAVLMTLLLLVNAARALAYTGAELTPSSSTSVDQL